MDIKSSWGEVFATMVLILFILNAVPSSIGDTSPISNTIYVDDDNTSGPWDGSIDHPYQYIQDGITAASNKDKVFVFNGTYYEHLTVEKEIELVGEDKDKTIIDGEYKEQQIFTISGKIKLHKFTIKNSSKNLTGLYVISSSSSIFDNNFINITNIKLFKTKNSIVEENKFTGFGGIIILQNCFQSIISHNEIYTKSNGGIHVFGSSSSFSEASSKNQIGGNVIKGSTSYGILDSSSLFDFISHNTIDSCKYGIKLNGVASNILRWNKVINNNGYGILIGDACNLVEVSYNVISNNSGNGIETYDDAGMNIITRNTISNNKENGIFIDWASFGHVISYNNITSNNIGAYIQFGYRNAFIKNNFINNTKQHVYFLHTILDKNNIWINNYFEDMNGTNTYIIKGIIRMLFAIYSEYGPPEYFYRPGFYFNLFPAKQPHEIMPGRK